MRISRSVATLSILLIAVLVGCHPFEDLSEDPFLDGLDDGLVADSKGDGQGDATPDVEPSDLLEDGEGDGQQVDGQQGDGVTVDDLEGDIPWTPAAERVAANCDTYCRKLALCGLLDTANFEACTQTCADGLGSMDPVWFRKVACSAEAECGNISACDKPLVPLPACVSVCDAIETCGTYSMFEMFDNHQACIWSCEGAGMAGTNFAGKIDCLTEALTASCTAAGPILACLSPFDCAGLCSANMEGCTADSPLYQSFPSLSECKSYCEALEYGPKLAFEVCLQTRTCDAVGCELIPADPFVGCRDLCAKSLTLCSITDPLEEFYCRWYCTALDNVFAFVDASSTEAKACKNNLQGCVDSELSELPPSLQTAGVCLFQTDSRCDGFCSHIAACPDIIAPQDCPYTCSEFLVMNPDPAVFNDLQSCLSLASNGNGTTEEKCLAKAACLGP